MENEIKNLFSKVFSSITKLNIYQYSIEYSDILPIPKLTVKILEYYKIFDELYSKIYETYFIKPNEIDEMTDEKVKLVFQFIFNEITKIFHSSLIEQNVNILLEINYHYTHFTLNSHKLHIKEILDTNKPIQNILK
jgi:hypothetical protein